VTTADTGHEKGWGFTLGVLDKNLEKTKEVHMSVVLEKGSTRKSSLLWPLRGAGLLYMPSVFGGWGGGLFLKWGVVL